MAYINLITQKYPVSEQEIRIFNPNISFPVPFIPPSDYAWVFPTPAPAHDAMTQTVRESAPGLVNGGYEQQWEILPLAAEQIAANQEAKAKAVFLEIQYNIQKRLDVFAQTRMYDDIKAAADYAGDEDPIFNAEGSYAKVLRSRTWRAATNIMQAVMQGTRPMPAGFAEIEAELPEMTWPVV